ncbi:histone deacetylase 2-like [Pistacia vera]|uniref:histone deacetylase 2-like n=1 Tax=Pistacia vera TaxID=55513 RepID=UPI001262DC94|nr:histone deacetylase 2-like [Pistacia vera]
MRNLTMSSSSSTSTATDAETLQRNRILSSKLYFDVPLPRHPFDSSKWGRICQFLNLDGVLDKTRIVEPMEASKKDLLVGTCRRSIWKLSCCNETIKTLNSDFLQSGQH